MTLPPVDRPSCSTSLRSCPISTIAARVELTFPLSWQNLRTVVAVLDEACAALPTASALLTQGLDAQLIELVDVCRTRAEVQKRVIEREMEVWQIIEEQRRNELTAQTPTAAQGPEVHPPREIDMGEPKRLQRGSVGSDRGG